MKPIIFKSGEYWVCSDMDPRKKTSRLHVFSYGETIEEAHTKWIKAKRYYWENPGEFRLP